MRYWIRQDTMAYELSDDDMSRFGYIEVTERPSTYSDMWTWSFESWSWVVNKESAKKVISQKCFDLETSGVVYEEHTFGTDDRNKILLTMMALQATRDNTKVFSCKTADGEFVDISATDIQLLVDGISDYTQACLLREKDLLVQLSGDDFSVEAMDEGWPSNIIA